MIRDWARAYADLPRDSPRRHIERMLAFWEPHFDDHDVLPIESSGRNAERSPGMVIDLFLDLADLTGEDRWVDAAAELADPVLETFFEETVPRRAHGAACYEAQRGCDALLGGLARLGLRLRDGVDVGPMDTVA